jgi:lipoprotein NlpI
MPAEETDCLTRAAPGEDIVGVLGIGALKHLDLIVDGIRGFAYLHPRPAVAVPDWGNWTISDNVRITCDGLLVREGIDECSRSNLDAALADYTQALAVNSNNPEAYDAMALVHLQKGDAADAIAEENSAVALDADEATPFRNRAFAKQIAGDFPGALEDYDRAMALNPNDSTIALHHEALLYRLGKASAQFPAAVASWQTGWNKTIGLFIADELDEGSFLIAAGDTPGQRCEAFYYVGIKHLADGDETGARDYFEKTVATEIRQYIEYQMAAAQLARLYKTPSVTH